MNIEPISRRAGLRYAGYLQLLWRLGWARRKTGWDLKASLPHGLTSKPLRTPSARDGTSGEGENEIALYRR
jgi:hypothetical protein